MSFKKSLCATVGLALVVSSHSAFAGQNNILPSEEAPTAIGKTTQEPDAWSALMVGGSVVGVSALLIAIGGTGGDSSDGGSKSPDPEEDPPPQGFLSDHGSRNFNQASTQRRDALHRLKLFSGVEERSVETLEAGSLSITTATKLGASGAGLGHDSYSRMGITFASDSFQASVSANPDVSRDLGLRRAGFAQAAMMDARAFDQPHVAGLAQGFGSSFSFHLSDSSDLQITGFSGHTDDHNKSGMTDEHSLHGGVGQLVSAWDGGLVKASMGALSEEGHFLGSQSMHFDGNKMRSTTVFGSLGASVSLDSRTKLTFIGSVGHSSLDQGAGAAERDVVTSSFGIGLFHQGLLQDSDSLTFAVAQPLRVESGDLGFSSANASNFNSNPSAREVSLQASYGFNLIGNVDAAVGAMHSFNSNHVKGKQESIGLVTTTLRF